jgi:transposase
LADRSTESFATWLSAHPGVEIISRDRGDVYIKGATTGAPNAKQVADRWHLLMNLREVLAKVADRFPKQLLAAAHVVADKTPAQTLPSTEAMAVPGPKPKNQTVPDTLAQQRRTKRREQYENVLALHQQKVPLREIARRLDLHRSTVRRYIRADCFPERAKRKYAKGIDKFTEFLQRRWHEGCQCATTLTNELRSQGFEGSYYMVRRLVTSWRKRTSESSTPSGTAGTESKKVRRPSAQQVSWLMVKPEAEQTDDEKTWVKAIEENCSTLKETSILAKKFVLLVKEKRISDFESWLTEASSPDAADELRRFAQGLREDLAAVRAAIESEWSNGQTEGQVNRLKMIKRQMYGRANFDLLRLRVLAKAA